MGNMRDKKILCLLLCFLLCILSSAHAEESCVLVQYQTNHSALNQSTLDIASGMGYIIQDETGKLFAIDGGLEDDGYRFLQLLKEASGEEKPHVDMWFLSHPHSDHYGALKAIAGTYPNQLTVETILANFPPRDFVDTVKGTSYAPGETALDTIRYTLNAELAVPHTGDTYQVGQISIEVATTWEDLKQVNECNETSTILMVRAGEKKVLFLGDAYAATCKNAAKTMGINWHATSFRLRITRFAAVRLICTRQQTQRCT